MTTQTAVFSGLPTGLTLTKKVFTIADPDTEVTGITGAVTERTNAKGQYVVVVTKSAVITGDHTIILFLGSTPLAIGKRTFAGTDGEEATVTPEGAVLNAATLRRFVTEDTGEVSASAGSVAKLSQGGGSGGIVTNTIVTLQSVAAIQPGVIVGPSEPLIIGDDYLTLLGRAIRINLVDSNGDPAIVIFGIYSLDDAGIDIQLLLHKAGKPTVVADIVGTCTFSPAVEVDGVVIPPYLTVELPSTETEKATPGAYDMQAEAVWLDGKVVTFAPYGQLEFVRDIQRVP